MSGTRMPTDADRRAFVAKLIQFRSRLNPREQQMLNELVAAGRQAHEQGDVEVYWLTDATGEGGAASDVWALFTNTVSPTGPTPRGD
jgi:hypothetical protein